MNREEQIKEAAEKYLNDNDEGLDYIGAAKVDTSFQAGAKWADEHREIKHKKWEYSIKYIDIYQQEESLKKYGLEGWEVCGYAYGRFIFKREIDE